MQLQKHRLQVTVNYQFSLSNKQQVCLEVKNAYCFLKILFSIKKLKQQMYRISTVLQIVIIAQLLNHNLKSQVFTLFSPHPVSAFPHPCHLMIIEPQNSLGWKGP